MGIALSWLYLKDMVAYLKNPSIPMWIRRDHKAQNEGGVDLTAPPGTPVYALATGPLLSSNSFANVGQGHPGDVVAQRINVPGYGAQDIYYQHINRSPNLPTCLGGNCGGVIVQAGEQIGTVGYVGETEIGFNPQGWGSLYGPDTHPGSWPDDPRPMIAVLMGSTANIPYTGGVPGGLTLPIPPNVAAWGQKVGLFVIGLFLILFGGYLTFTKTYQKIGSGIKSKAKLAAKVAVVA